MDIRGEVRAAVDPADDEVRSVVAEAMAGIFARQRTRCDTHLLTADNDGTDISGSRFECW